MAKLSLPPRLPLLTGLMLATAPLLLTPPADAHPPNWHAHPVRPRIDVIPPLGNNLPRSYAARYNRPAYLTGKLFYMTAPASREAMAWHRAVHRGYYANHAPRMVTQYFYPKPWEVLGGSAMSKPAAVDGETIMSGEAVLNGEAGKLPELLPQIPAPAELSEGVELAPPGELLPPPAEVP